jgi:hypothetical protein
LFDLFAPGAADEGRSNVCRVMDIAKTEWAIAASLVPIGVATPAFLQTHRVERASDLGAHALMRSCARRRYSQ